MAPLHQSPESQQYLFEDNPELYLYFGLFFLLSLLLITWSYFECQDAAPNTTNSTTTTATIKSEKKSRKKKRKNLV